MTTLSFNHLEQNGFTKSKLYLSTIGWKVNVTRRLNDKKGYGLKKTNEMDYGLKKINETMTKAEVMRGWVMMPWWNLSVMKSITEQRDDQNPNLQSIFSLGHQWCWLSKAYTYIKWSLDTTDVTWKSTNSDIFNVGKFFELYMSPRITCFMDFGCSAKFWGSQIFYLRPSAIFYFSVLSLWTRSMIWGASFLWATKLSVCFFEIIFYILNDYCAAFICIVYNYSVGFW